MINIEMDQIFGLDSQKREKNRSVCSASIIWGNNHHIHLHLIISKELITYKLLYPKSSCATFSYLLEQKIIRLKSTNTRED